MPASIRSLSGVKRMTSRNYESVTSVILEFELEVDGPGGREVRGYHKPVMIAGGLPLAIGPFTGNRTSRRRLEVKQVRAPGEDERCGERPVAATAA